MSLSVIPRAYSRAKSKSAAELRAEAAERRLAALNPKQELKEEDEDELVSKEDEKPTIYLDDSDDTDDDDIEVIDPHISIKERKRELESEMTSDERSGLKSDWWQDFKDLLSPDRGRPSSSRQTPFWEQDSSEDNTDAYPPSSSAEKRKAATDSSSSRTPKKKAVTATPTLDFSAAHIVREERLRALGLSATSSGSTARTLGGSSEGRGRTSGAASRTTLNDVGRSSKPPSPGKVKTVKLDSGAQGWQCHACTYINHADQGRCGEWR